MTRAATAAMVTMLGIPVAMAQSPPDAGSQFSEQQRLQRRLPDRMPQIEQAEPERPALRAPGGEKVVIHRIRFSGAEGLAAESELDALLADAIGEAHDFAGLEALAQRVTDYLKNAGFLLARAYLPRQDVTEGDLEIAILAGRLDTKGEPVKIVPGGKLALRIAPDRLRAMADVRLQPGAVARDEDIQRVLLLMNDLPGITARSRLEPGETTDTTRVVVDVEEGPLLTVTTSLDNYGSRYTGEYRVVVSAQADDPLGIGDRLALSATGADDSETMMLNYSLPLGYDGWRLGFSASDMKSTLSNLGSKSSSDTFGVTLSYPIIRTRRQNLSTSIGLDRRRYTDVAKDGSPTGVKETLPLTIGLSGDLTDQILGGGFTQFGVGHVSGQLDLQLPVVLSGDVAGARSHGHYSKWTWNASRLQRLDGPWTVLLAASGQMARKNLDSSEKFALGGPTAIRAYPGSEGSGDEGSVTTAELRYELPASSFGQSQVSAFFDHGRIRLHHAEWAGSVTNAAAANVYTLKGFGIAAQLSKLGSHSIRLAVARRIGDNPGRTAQNNQGTGGKDADGLTIRTRAWLQGIFWF